jgi:hypothetical protein
MLHGHLLLHGWLLGDATFYTFELPLIALVEVFFGLHTIVMYVAMAAIYLVVAVCAVAIAVAGATGAAARLSRAAVVAAVLTAPALVISDRWIPLGFPDHMGTPYSAAANLVAAAVSLPLATAVRALMRHFGAYLMVSPRASLAPVSHWPHNAAVTWYSLQAVRHPGRAARGRGHRLGGGLRGRLPARRGGRLPGGAAALDSRQPGRAGADSRDRRQHRRVPGL